MHPCWIVANLIHIYIHTLTHTHSSLMLHFHHFGFDIEWYWTFFFLSKSLYNHWLNLELPMLIALIKSKKENHVDTINTDFIWAIENFEESKKKKIATIHFFALYVNNQFSQRHVIFIYRSTSILSIFFLFSIISTDFFVFIFFFETFSRYIIFTYR